MLLGAVAPAIGADPYDTGRLWRVSRTGIPDSFVLGTIHVADPRVAVLAKPVATALARSRTLAVELVPEARDAATSDLEELEGGKRLEPLVGAAAYARIRDELSAQGLAPAAIERMKPWAAMLKIARSARGAGAQSLDGQLLATARMRRLRVLPLELLEEQIAAFDTIPVATQVAMLRHALDNRDMLAGNVEPTIAAWLRGDLAGLARIADRTYEQFPDLRVHYSRLIKHMILDRTALMHHRLFLPLRSGRVFVAVGALHLYGEQGLLALLREDGYRLTRVW
ncbi:MAG: TraB/GumN family protein [Betaproteobacteria bacterium]|nr:TraB/GumN family protein [Betaproteobacteria bacterium]